MINKKILHTLLLALAFLIIGVTTVQAIEVAPRISDRDIIEKLAGLEAGQRSLRSEMKAGQEALRSEMKAGQEALRSEMKAGQKALDVRISDLRSEMKSGQEALRSEMKSGQEALNSRMVSLENTMLALFGAMIALIVALIGYLAWDRRTLIRPVVERLDSLEREVVIDLDLRHVEGSLLARQLKALREYARNDTKLAEILRSLSLL